MKSHLLNIMSYFTIALFCVNCNKGEKATVSAPVNVKIITPQFADLTQSASYSGTVEESSGTVLSFAVAGTIKSLNVDEGSMIKKGQLIGEIDNATLKHAWEISNDALATAQDTYNRMKKLHDSNSLPEMRWVEVQNTLASAKSAEAIARKAMDDAKLYAPSDGYIAEKMVQAGSNIAMGMPVVRVVNINPVKVNIAVPENDISKLAIGEEGKIHVNATGGKDYAGKIVEKGVSANPLSRSYAVKLQVPNPALELLPGMICEVRIQREPNQSQSVLVLPVNTVLLDADNHNFVWIARNGHAYKRIVQTEGFSNGGIVVTSGLASTDSVIVSGQQKVSNNSPITIL